MRTPSVTTNTVDRITADFLTPGDRLVAYTRVRADLELIVIVRKLALGRLTVGVIDLDEPGIIRGDELVTSGTPRTDDIDHALNTVANRELKRLAGEERAEPPTGCAHCLDRIAGRTRALCPSHGDEWEV